MAAGCVSAVAVGDFSRLNHVELQRGSRSVGGVMANLRGAARPPRRTEDVEVKWGFIRFPPEVLC